MQESASSRSDADATSTWLPYLGAWLHIATETTPRASRRFSAPLYRSICRKNTPFDLGTFRIFPFRTEHDTPEPVGYLLYSRVAAEKLLYFTDSYYIKARFSGVTHIIGECNYDSDTMWSKVDAKETQAFRAKRLFVSHMSLDTFCDFLCSIEHREKLKQIYICHLSEDHGNSDKIKETIERLTGAEVYICEREGF